MDVSFGRPLHRYPRFSRNQRSNPELLSWPSGSFYLCRSAYAGHLCAFYEDAPLK